MPRPLRPELAGGVHHVYARGVARQAIFLDDFDRRRYLSTLGAVTRRMAWLCLGYCLMGNHMHLLVETPLPNLGRGMQVLHGAYAQAFNRRHERSGHVFGGRFGSVGIYSDVQLWVTAAYIARNPVEAGLVRSPERWPWSSYASIAAAAEPSWLAVGRLSSYFAQMGGEPIRRYIEYVAVAAAPTKPSELVSLP